jgi:F-type H+-transporting ATPase subunit b
MIISLIAFAIMYWLYKTKVVPRMEQLYAERTAAIEGGMAQAEEAQAEADAAKAKYEAQLADARAEANRIREDAREQGASIIAELRSQAQAEAARITESAQRQIEAERSQAAISLRADVGRMSTDLATRIVGESIDDTMSANIIERFLADLESGQAAPEKVGSDGAGQDS